MVLRSHLDLTTTTFGLDKLLQEFLALYRWFTERFDTADLKEAKALLDEMS